MARYKSIDQKTFEGLCKLQCTEQEIADFFEVDTNTLEGWCKRTYKQSFSEVFAQKRGQGRISLRRMQMRLAENNSTMLIFLGKNYLGQKDSQEIEISKRAYDIANEVEDYIENRTQANTV